MRSFTMKPEDINVHNRSILLELIRRGGPISRAEIARKTNLSAPSITRIVKDLMAEGLIKETGIGDSSGGRKPYLLEFNTNAKYIVGVELGETYSVSVLTDLEINYLSREKIAMKMITEVDKVIDLLVESIRGRIKQSKVDKGDILGIGIGVPGTLDTQAGIIKFSPNFGWKNVPIVEIMEKELGISTFIDTGVRAMTLCERWFGAGQGIKNFACVIVGTGIGAGLIINGNLYRGFEEAAGEIGHTTVLPEGPKCKCGNRGCLETLAAGPSLVRRALARISEHPNSSLANALNKNKGDITADMVIEEAKRGDSLACEIVQEAGHYLGIGVANLINIFAPEAVIIGGWVAEQAGELFLEAARETIKNRVFMLSPEKIRVLPASLKDNDVAIGAATLALQQLSIPLTKTTVRI